jgi:radical SAM/Cys-rich protein
MTSKPLTHPHQEDPAVRTPHSPWGNNQEPSGSFDRVLRQHGLSPLCRDDSVDLQLNLGYLCNQACTHCHVDAGPKRTELMTQKTMNRILTWCKQHGIRRVDLTGGAPELNPHFRYLGEALTGSGIAITSRCNLTLLSEPGQGDLGEWYADHRVRLVCSLPCYTQHTVDEQRGRGVYERSIAGLKALNQLGYGDDQSLVLDLVYNPSGAYLPPSQASLEAQYRERLMDEHAIVFDRLLTLTNLPINRFAHQLKRSGDYARYLGLLEQHFNPDTVPALMCRTTLSVDWQGRVFDCDFNQLTHVPLGDGPSTYLWDLYPAELFGQRIAVRSHCLGCTAGAGSSCAGALVP